MTSTKPNEDRDGHYADGQFPFSAVHGADQMRLALLLNAVSPAIGGVLVRGEKGTAKSTAVRALASLLPAVRVVVGCRFSCDPASPAPLCPDGPHGSATGEARPARLVELPVGASEDRLVGSLDLQKALSQGVRAFEPGLLAAAHRGILYVDEVNLLSDHLVDALLDAAAMGRNIVERDAVSVTHPARFVLIGSMNPEEGELRPQLLDRFGLTVDVAASRDPQVRVEVVRRRLAADADPVSFASNWAAADAELSARIARAQDRLQQVELTDSALLQIAEVCAAFDVDGMRADIVTARTAIAHAAWHDRTRVTAEDVKVAAMLALPHRRRRNPFDEPGLDPQALDDALSRAEPPEPDPEPDGGGASEPSGEGSSASGESPAGQDGAGQPAGTEGPDEAPAGESGERQAAVGTAGRAKRLAFSRRGVGAVGRRAAGLTDRGRAVGVLPAGTGHGSVHLPATITAAAVRGSWRGDALEVAAADVRYARTQGRHGNLVLFVVDASGSMAARSRMSDVKGAIMSLLTDAYQRRDKVGLITFRGSGAEVVLPPTLSASNAAKQLATIATGGRTPLAAGLSRAAQVIAAERLRDQMRRPLVLVVTDGRADLASALKAGTSLRGEDIIILDSEQGFLRLGLAKQLADELGVQYLPLAEVTASPLTALVRQWQAA